MNELLKGLIGAELTLLGVSGQVAPDEPSARTSPLQGKGAAGKGIAGKGTASATQDDTGDSRPSVAFDQCDYRTAAG